MRLTNRVRIVTITSETHKWPAQRFAEQHRQFLEGVSSDAGMSRKKTQLPDLFLALDNLF